MIIHLTLVGENASVAGIQVMQATAHVESDHEESVSVGGGSIADNSSSIDDDDVNFQTEKCTLTSPL